MDLQSFAMQFKNLDLSVLTALSVCLLSLNFVQARLNEIITSGMKTIHTNGSSDCPWMVDGAGLPPNASELLSKLVNIFKVKFRLLIWSLYCYFL